MTDSLVRLNKSDVSRFCWSVLWTSWPRRFCWLCHFLEYRRESTPRRPRCAPRTWALSDLRFPELRFAPCRLSLQRTTNWWRVHLPNSMFLHVDSCGKDIEGTIHFAESLRQWMTEECRERRTLVYADDVNFLRWRRGETYQSETQAIHDIETHAYDRWLVALVQRAATLWPALTALMNLAHQPLLGLGQPLGRLNAIVLHTKVLALK